MPARPGVAAQAINRVARGLCHSRLQKIRRDVSTAWEVSQACQWPRWSTACLLPISLPREGECWSAVPPCAASGGGAGGFTHDRLSDTLRPCGGGGDTQTERSGEDLGG